MFGFGKDNKLLKELNLRNEYCAKIFHDLATPILEAQSGEKSERQLVNKDVVSVLNFDLENTRDALKQREHGDVAAAITIQHIQIIEKSREKMLDSFGSNQELMNLGGAISAIGTCRRLVFAVAPAFGKNRVEVKAHTTCIKFE